MLSSARGQSAPPSSEDVQCKTGGRPVKILIGRFLEFGSDERAGLDMDRTIAAGVFGRLASSPDWAIAPSVFRETRETARVAPQVESVFIGGDRPSDSRTLQLTPWLKANNCNYLFGGQVSRQGDLYVLTPYLLDTVSSAVLRPFPSLFFGRQDNPVAIGDTLAARLADFIKSRVLASLPKPPQSSQQSVTIEFGCLGPALQPVESAEIGDRLRRILHRSLLRGRSLDPEGRCLDSRQGRLEIAGRAPGPVIVLGGSSERINGVIVFRPVMTVMASGTDTALAIKLPELRGETLDPRAQASRAIPGARYVEASIKFLDGVTDDDWRIPFDIAQSRELAGQELAEFVDRQLKGRSRESAIFAAYRAYSMQEDDALANYVLGKALMTKGTEFTDMALYHLDRARRTSGKLPVALQADYLEQLGRALVSASRLDEGVNALSASFVAHQAAGHDSELGRLARSISAVHVRLHDLRRAKEALLMQPGVRFDAESLLSLARLEATDEKYDAAEEWISAAVNLSIGSPATKQALASMTDALGSRLWRAGNYPKATEKYRQSLVFDDDPRVRLNLASSLFRERKYVEASREYESLLNPASQRKIAPDYLDTVWMCLLEAYLVSGNPALELRAKEADRALEAYPQSRILANYLIVVGRIIRSRSFNADSFQKADGVYVELNRMLDASGTIKLGWYNGFVEELVRTNPTLRQEQKAFFEILTSRVFGPRENQAQGGKL